MAEPNMFQFGEEAQQVMLQAQNTKNVSEGQRKFIVSKSLKIVHDTLRELEEATKYFSDLAVLLTEEAQIMDAKYRNTIPPEERNDIDTYRHVRALRLIPDEMQIMIFCYLDIKSLLAVSRVCKYWYKISRDDTLWRLKVEQKWKIDHIHGIDSSRWRSTMPARKMGVGWYKYYIEQDFLRTTRYIETHEVEFGDFVIQKTHYKIFRGRYNGHEVQLLVPKDVNKYRIVVEYWKELKHKNLLPLLAIFDQDYLDNGKKELPPAQMWSATEMLASPIPDRAGQLRSPQCITKSGRIRTLNAKKLASHFPFFLVSPYFEKSLEEVLKSHPPLRLDAKELVQKALDLAEGLDYLHNKTPRALLFQDLKPPKILIGHGGELILGDFTYIDDIDSVRSRGSTSGRARGSPLWMAPEKLQRRNNVDVRSDIFSFALVLWQFLPDSIGLEPDEDLKSFSDLVERRVNFQKRPSLPNVEDTAEGSVLAGIFELIRECWRHDKDKRPSSQEIVVKLKQFLAKLEEGNFLLRGAESASVSEEEEQEEEEEEEIIGRDDKAVTTSTPVSATIVTPPSATSAVVINGPIPNTTTTTKTQTGPDGIEEIEETGESNGTSNSKKAERKKRRKDENKKDKPVKEKITRKGKLRRLLGRPEK